MRRKYTLALLIVLVLAVAGYLGFRGWGRSEAAWTLIPSNTLAVISSNKLQDSVYVATDAQINLKNLPIIDAASENLGVLNWFTPDASQVAVFLHNKTITYSYHPRSGAGAGIIMYIPIANDQERQWLASPRRSDIRVLHHTFQNQEITDINDTRSRNLFSYLVKDDYLIISRYGDLIEDVIRKSSSKLQGFLLQSQFEYANDADYGFSLYVKKGAWQNLLLKSAYPVNLIEFAKLFPGLQDYHLIQPEKSKVIAFESMGCDPEDNYLTSWIAGQDGMPFSHHGHISQQTSYLYRIASKDREAFKEKYLAWNQTNTSEARAKLNYYIGSESNRLTENTGSELILCQLEESNSISDGKVLLVELSNYDKIRPLLSRLARLSTPETGVSLDQFQGYDLFSVAVPELPAGLYGPLFSGFARSYITYVAPYLVLSNNSQALRNYIVDYENQLTWKQSPDYDSLLTDQSSVAQLALVVNVRKAESGVSSAAPGLHSDLSLKMESMVYECRFDGSKAYPKLALVPKKQRTPSKVLNRTFLNTDIQWPQLYDQELATLQNPEDGSPEILLTDKTNTLFKINDIKEGKVIPLTRLDGPLSTTSYKVDFLNIGRQQRIIATPHRVYAIDEDEKGIVTPLSTTLLDGQSINALYRVDGGTEGSSRFVLKTPASDLFVWDRAGTSPRRINRFIKLEDIQSPVVALNQLGNKHFIVTQRNGKIYLFKEDGMVKQGFPADILTRTESPFAWSQNPATNQPELVGVSALGELIYIDMAGKITSRKQLLRPESSTRFKLLFDKNSLDWLIIRASDTRMAILNKEGEELFEVKNLQRGSAIQYHFFGVDNRFISVQSGGFTSVFDLSGRRLGDKPIPSDQPVGITYQPAFYKLFVFSRSGTKIQTWSIKLR
ncbi:hypothetical protein [Telluribacter sp. SYSU D00476]|uniref:hypothetical protein n=1 Tax=Telluribacter sp. SYSU D00476 TaxID=2811430 RepID=UPI001FF515A9|nr:hypothetical protein [Telluribacter sp. SYSU D00476]